MSVDLSLDVEAAIARLMRFLAVEGVTGQEKNIATEVKQALIEVGVPGQAIRFDTANQRIPLPTQTGNLIVQLPGTRKGHPLLFSTHLDTVPLCAGAVPVRKKNKIVPEGRTALGGDNRTGVAALVTLAATLLARRLPHPPLTLLFTVREESGLFGARYLDPADLGGVVMGFNIDGRLPSDLITAAVGAERWEVEITGKASHAGAHPEQGISATLVAALALAEVKQAGYFGKVMREGKVGTSNVGSFGGANGKQAGDATNVVTDYVRITGEARSHDSKFTKEIVKAYKDAFARAAEQVTDDKGKTAKLKFVSRLDYHPFQLKDNAPVIARAKAAAELAGLTPNLRSSNGGLDANWLVKHGIPAVTFGAGQNAIHTVDEWVDLEQFEQGCRMALACAVIQ
ncbi:MAG: M20/M25/M40 family metallo-hydrolase [Gemmataceae bacterium]